MFPNLPTDNIYKFLCIGGLILLIASTIGINNTEKNSLLLSTSKIEHYINAQRNALIEVKRLNTQTKQQLKIDYTHVNAIDKSLSTLADSYTQDIKIYKSLIYIVMIFSLFSSEESRVGKECVY